MGGVWGLASSTALENLPLQLRGLASGILQQGVALGYLIAAVINLTLVPEQKEGWRGLFWTAAGLSFFAAVVRALVPESEVFLRARRIEKEREIKEGVVVVGAGRKTKVFVKQTWKMLTLHWKLGIYTILLMSGFNFMSHGSQVGPFFLRRVFGFMSGGRICTPRMCKLRRVRLRTRRLLLLLSGTS